MPYDDEDSYNAGQERFRERRGYEADADTDYDYDDYDNRDNRHYSQQDRFRQMRAPTEVIPTMVPAPAGPNDAPPAPPGSADAPPTDDRPCAKTSDGCVAAELHSDLSQLNTDPEQAKLDGQLEDTEADIVSRKRSIKNELQWITQVEVILKNYAQKIEKVKAHIDTEKKALADLKTKKKKISNLIKKKQLEEELRSTSEDLNELQNELKQVIEREDEFNKSKDDLKTKISELETQITSLKGDDGSSSSSGAAAGGDDTSSDGTKKNPTDGVVEANTDQ